MDKQITKLKCFFGKHDTVTLPVEDEGYKMTVRCCKNCSYTEYLFFDGFHKIDRTPMVEDIVILYKKTSQHGKDII